MALQSLILPIISLFRSAGINQASNALKSLTGSFNSLSGQIGAAAASFSAFQVLSSARAFTIESVEAANRFERNLLGLNQVFEEMQPRIVGFTKEVENYGLSQTQAAQAAVFLGSVLKQYGFSVTESADQTERLVTLAQDLATTYGYDVQEALLAITALFRGEYDPIEKFGVAMKQNEVNARIAAQGLGDLEGAALANAQAIARLEMLFERAGDSVGAFTRASDTLYGSQQKLNAVMGNLQLAFGEPFQEPLAKINSLFADLAQEFGPEIVEIGTSIAATVDAVIPIVAALTRTFLELISPLKQIIDLLNFVFTIVGGIAAPVLEGINQLLGVFNALLDAGSAALGAFGGHLDKANKKGDDFKGVLENMGIDLDRENSLERLTRWLNSVAMGFERAGGAAEVFASNLHFTELGAVAIATEATNLANKVNALDVALRAGGSGAKDAEGKLTGLSGVFERIDEAIGKSKAKQSMEDLGLSAALIEEVLTSPNWEAIFQRISRLAKLTAIDIRTVMSVTAAAGIMNEIATIQAELDKLFKTDTKASGKNAVAEFYAGIRDEVAKQQATQKLISMGASQGLIDAILGSSDWQKVFDKVIRSGKAALRALQDDFNRTKTGMEEIANAAEKVRKANEALLKSAQDAIKENIRLREQQRDEDERTYLAMQKAAEEFKRWSLANIATMRILPDFEQELGKFEQDILNTIRNIQSELVSAVRSGLIFEDDFATLERWVNTESAALINIARRRDELAKNYALSESLIREYQAALTGALSLTSLFSRLKNETEKRTVTEVQRGVVMLGRTLREFEVIVTRTYEEPIQVIQNKTEGLVQGFRDMAEKARAFGANLRTLKALGLDPMLFNQLVQAGAEAGGETAQAIVDGGSEAVNELNSIFNELNLLGAELGMDVGRTMYDAGKDMTFGLLDGIRSEQEALLELARSMAEAFSREFQAKLTIAVDKPVQAAKDTFEKADEVFEQAKVANAALLAQVYSLIEGARKALAGPLSTTFRAGITEKLGILEGLVPDIVSARITELPGLRAGLSTDELKQIVATARGETIVNYNINVNADTSAGGARAGQAIVESLQQFQIRNGAFALQIQ